MRVVELKKEEVRLRKLVNVARPSNVPEIEIYNGPTGNIRLR